jgi:hypothetical protein
MIDVIDIFTAPLLLQDKEVRLQNNTGGGISIRIRGKDVEWGDKGKSFRVVNLVNNIGNRKKKKQECHREQ